MDVQAFLDTIRASRHYRDQIVYCHRTEARPARFAEPVVTLDASLRNALAAEGIERFYTHQAASIDAASPPAAGDVVVVTGTASGKTLCYNVPVIAALLRDPGAKALYLFPTKALAQDQLGTLQRLCRAEPRLAEIVRPSTYDGDTPVAKRRAARSEANIILSNPDMLHASILPNHGRWARDKFFTDLKYVVLDEVHSYRGTFGSHVAGVIRRLRRICHHYGSDPTFICCSATIANPGELAGRLIGREVTVVDDDGSPRGCKHFVLWNPPLIDEAGLERRSANIEAQELMGELMLHGAQTITFARARVVAELIYKYVHEDLTRRDPSLAKRTRPYRGGYLASERREIERQLFSGELRGVCCTNALELGIDVGTLDAAIVVGFPGTICSVRQQAGRAGRTSEESLAVLVAYNDPIDQYFMRHPEYFFGQSPEHAAVDPLNEKIFESQLQCAAHELPIAEQDAPLFNCDPIEAAARYRENASPDDIWTHWPDGRFSFHRRDARRPHQLVNLRMIGNESFDILDITDGRNESIAVVDSISAPELVYPNAIYLHKGEDFLVRDLDFAAKIARVERIEVDYYTQAVLADHCRVVDVEMDEAVGGGRKYFGRLDVTWQTIAFKKIKHYTLEVIGQDGLDLPPQTIHTTGLWATLPKRVVHSLRAAGHKPIEALVGIRNMFLVVLPMTAMCDRRDMSGCVESSNLAESAMFVYDRYEGGLGYARLGFAKFAELLAVCKDLVSECGCAEGCPSCVGLANVRPPLHIDPDLGPGYAIPDKAATVLALSRWLEPE